MALTIEERTQDFIESYNDYYPLIFSIVFSKLDNVDEARDITQEVFTRFFEKYDTVRNSRKWLYGALRIVMIDYFKKKENRNVNVDDMLDDVSLSFVNGFRDTRIIIKEALDDMNNFEDEKSRILFELISIHNFTYGQAGRQLNLTERQVRYKYGIIQKRLIDYFSGRGILSLEDLL